MKAPKIENRPMKLVIAAERKIRINKSARAEGEISPPPARKVMAVHRRSSRRPTRIMKRAYASASATMVMVANGLNLDRTIALTRARVIQPRSVEHTSELQSRGHLVCRLLLEKKKKKKQYTSS